MSDTRIIRNKLRRLLPTLDLETATQRTIQEQLEDELGIPLDDYKSVIKAEVDAFLLGMNPEEADLPASEPPPAKRPRQDAAGSGGGSGAGGPSPAAATTAAAAAPSPSTANTDLLGGRTGPGDFIYSFPISKLRFAGVRTYKGRAMVDIREYFEKDGQSTIMPGKKGLTFSPEQWAALTAGMVAVNDALERNDSTFYLDLGGNKRATVSLFNGKMMISLREHYEKDGAMLPGKKGISLPPDQWLKLCAVHEMLTQRLSALPGGSASKQPKSQQTSTPASTPGGCGAGSHKNNNISTATATTNAATTPTKAAATPSGGGTTGGGSADAAVSLPLVGLRRIEVVNKKGKAVVDIREFYLKDGVMSHTKKGLQLTPEQFQILKESCDAITAALNAENEGFEIILAPKRKVTISNFKGRFSVDLREYYDKDGTLAPTPKGISLNKEQWDKVVAALPTIARVLADEAGGGT